MPNCPSISREISKKLIDLGGLPPLKNRINRIKSLLQWRDVGAENRIKHLIYEEQRATIEQVDEIRLAHARYLVEQFRIHSAEDSNLFDHLRAFLDMAEHTDPDFYQPVYKEIGQLIGSLGNPPRKTGVVGRKPNNPR